MSGDRGAQQLERLTFFSDAVFAIAITLLVIEIHVPHVEHGGDAAYLAALAALLPHLLGFVLSFMVIGALWISHHRVFGMLRGFERGLLWPNLLVLLAVAFMPFATAFMAANSKERVPAMCYAGWLLLAGLLQRWLFSRALQPQRLDASVTATELAEVRWRSWALPIVALLALLVAYLAPVLSYLLYLLIPLLVGVLALLGRRRAVVRERHAGAAESAVS